MARAKQPRILDDPRAYGAAWASTPFADRRRITKAINRGLALDDGVEAQLAVMTARRQITFWRWGWLIGPALTLLQVGSATSVFLVSMAMSTFATGALSVFFLRRARRAEARNLALAEQSAARAGRAGASGRPHPRSQQAEELAARAAATRRWWQRRA